MTAEGRKDVFLSCFKCGRIVRSSDTECPRCGLQFGPGTLFECPFCCGLVWRNATTCTTCGIDLTKFSDAVEKASAGFDMDRFVDTMISTEVEQMRSTIRRVSCPGCGLMIRGDETRCPRCDLPLQEAQVDCPVCGEQIPASSKSCPRCGALLIEVERKKEKPRAVEVKEKPTAAPKAAKKTAAPKRAAGKKKAAAKSKAKK